MEEEFSRYAVVSIEGLTVMLHLAYSAGRTNEMLEEEHMADATAEQLIEEYTASGDLIITVAPFTYTER